jgi:hypothetical protein
MGASLWLACFCATVSAWHNLAQTARIPATARPPV